MANTVELLPNKSLIRSIDDVDTVKKWIDHSILSSFEGKEYKGKKHTLKISNPVIEQKEYTLGDQKDALLTNRNLSRPLKGTVELIDNETGNVIERRNGKLLAHIPYHTGRNTVISNGVEYVPFNQMRLRPGAYTRVKENQEVETHFNLVSGTGSGFRLRLEPQTGIFNFVLGTVKIKLYPLLKALGANDSQLEKIWGKEVLNINRSAGSGQSITKLYSKLIMYPDPNATNDEKVKAIIDTLSKAKMEAEVNNVTLGKPYTSVNLGVLLDATARIIRVSKNEEQPDDRDSLQFKKVFSIEDFYKEKIEKDAGDLGKTLIRKLDRKPDLKKMPSGYFSRQVWGTIKGDSKVSPKGTLAQPIEEINPIDIYDQQQKVTVLGEGGIGDINIVTMEARNVHPSQFGFIDHVRSPESANVGIDQRLAYGVRKGSDNKLYKKFINAKTGKPEWLDPIQVNRFVVAFPGEWESKKAVLQVMNKGTLEEVPRSRVEYYLEDANDLYSTYTNLVPLGHGIQGNRMVMAGKAMASTMPLVHGEAPLVRSKNPKTGKSFEYDIGRKIMAKESKVDGVVHKVTDTDIFVKDSKGNTQRHGLYNNFPLNLKTYLHNRPLVKPGDRVKKGDLLATSNYTDDRGVMSSGVNLHSAYIPYKGYNFEDGIVISSTAAKKLASEQMYTYEYDIDDAEKQIVDKSRYLAVFPSVYQANQVANIASNGVIQKGATVKPNDPLILVMERRQPSTRDIQLGNLHKSLKSAFNNRAVVWDHHSEGVVTDVTVTGKVIKVYVKTMTAAKTGDKLTGRFGNKGVISLVLPDEQMPQVKGGEKLDILLNPLGVPSRINPSQKHEALLGKIAKKRGKPYLTEMFKSNTLVKDIQEEAKKYGVNPEDDLYFPDENREVKGVFTGRSYIWKISKMSEGEMKKRSVAGYTADEQPTKGKSEQGQAMRIGTMELNALIGHNARHNLREMSTIKGQKNEDFWRSLSLGQVLPTPGVPFIYKKFITNLEGAGINVKKEGNIRQLMPMTDREILKRSGGEIKRADLLNAKNMMPIREGLFDPVVTGGTVGNKWSHIRLSEPVPNPIMEEPIKRILGVSKKKFIEKVQDKSIIKDLATIDMDKEIREARELMRTGRGTKKDNAVRKLGYLEALKENNLKPRDLILSNVGVIPPVFRPVSQLGSGAVSPGNANLLYKDLMTANDGLKMLKGEVPDEDLGAERSNIYRALKAVQGLGDPINVQNKNKGVKGFIKEITGDQPKTGMFQSKLMSKPQDNVGRAVAIPDPALNLDQVGLPKEMAWKMYEKFIMRRLVQQGVPALTAAREIKERTARAAAALKAEMDQRPVIMNRNPSLHKYNIMAFNPVMRNDNAIAASPPVASGFNLDHDGDQVNVYLPVTPEAVDEAKQVLMPSKNLFHIKNRKVHYLPLQDPVLGLYSLTNKKPTGNAPKRTFNNINELRGAFSRGELKPTDPVKVLNYN